LATVSAPKKHLEAHCAEEERRSCSDVSVELHHSVSLSVKGCVKVSRRLYVCVCVSVCVCVCICVCVCVRVCVVVQCFVAGSGQVGVCMQPPV